MMIREFKTRTGCIFSDTEKNLEWLYVGDYGKECNIKADFLGLTKEIHSVPHKEVDLSQKMVVTISTQKGCPMKCRFCDCPKVPFGGNATHADLMYQIEHAIKVSRCTETERFNLHLARMGEPSFNFKNIRRLLKEDLKGLVSSLIKAKTIHPVFTTMCPKVMDKEYMAALLTEFCHIKNEVYSGEAGLQLSINSTDEKQRSELFNGQSMTLEEIAQIAAYLPTPRGRKYTLNFPVTKETKLNPQELSYLFDKTKFIVKITPIHETTEAVKNGIQTEGGYENYNVYRRFEQPLLREGWEVIVFIPSKEEDEDRITCGNALLSEQKEG